MTALQALRRIQPAVAFLGQALRAVVDIQHDRVVALVGVLQAVGDIVLNHPGARIENRVAGLRAQRAAVPLDHSGHQLGDLHLGGLAQVLQRRGQGETHAQAANQHP